MYLIYLFILTLNLICPQATKSHCYKVQKNIDINTTISQTWLVAGYKAKTKFACLSKCNLNDACLNLIYIRSPSLNNNCFMYSKGFSSNDLISSNASDLYEDGKNIL